MNWDRKISASLERCNLPADDKLCRIIIEVINDDIQPVKMLIAAKGGEIVKEMKVISSLVAEIPPAAIQDLAKLRQVKRIVGDPKICHC